MRKAMKIISQLLIILFSSLLFGQDAEKTDLEIGDVAPTWALMYAPGKFEFLRNWSEVKIDPKFVVPSLVSHLIHVHQ